MPFKGSIPRTCEQCGTGFYCTPFHIKTGRGRFCGRACSNAAQSANRITVPCEACGKPVTRKPSGFRQRRAFCSWQCSRRRNAHPIILDDDGLTARVPLIARDGSVKAYAIIDATDAEWAGQWQWGLTVNGGYAYRGQGIRLHRELLGLKRGDPRFGDHINLNKLDNRRSNLRILTASESPQNVPGRKRTSAYRGVSWVEKRCLWQACVTLGGKNVYVEFFSDEQEAAEAARAARARLMPYATG